MSSGLRILHVADSHIGADLPRRRGARPRRGDDFVASYRRALRSAVDCDVDLVIHAGDVFDAPDPGDGAIVAAAEPLLALASAGIPVVIVPGNHERSALPQTLLLAHPLIHVIHEPRTILLRCGGQRVAIAGIPCLRRQPTERFAAALESTAWQQAAGDVNILVVHQAFDGARCGPANFRFRAGEDVIPLHAVPPAFHYVAAGHIHRHQSLAGGPHGETPLVYAGSPDRISFAEVDEPKGAVLVEFGASAARPRFLEHAVRAMAAVPLDVSGLQRAGVVARVLHALAALPADAVVQVRLTGRATRQALAGLELTRAMRAAYPNMLVSVAPQAIEWVDARDAILNPEPRGSSAPRSNGGPTWRFCAFEQLDSPETVVHAAAVSDLAGLPNACGTYALYDSADRLLYVGKALQARTRVRTHVAGRSGGGYFSQWSAQIARVAVRPAGSELEALLVEADLVQRLRPPFNRQMRMWQRYCYLRHSAAPHAQLEVCNDMTPGGFVFGPLPSRFAAEAAIDALAAFFNLAACPPEDAPRRKALPVSGAARLCDRYFRGDCSGPCAGRGDPADYAARAVRRDAFLAGESIETAAAAQQELDALTVTLAAEPAADARDKRQNRRRVLQQIVHLHERACTLAASRRLLNRPICLPAGDGGPRDAQPGGAMAAIITAGGLQLRRMDSAKAAVLPGPDGCEVHAGRLAVGKPIADSLATAVRYLRRGGGG